ncbi:MAG: MerR family transcriptional regulator [Planctomycetes bacterium]|jgi:DNA-binding transcriptional MerR regulator|nr:MerR family transcriptional regulator [Planctomycetota bacterium]MBT4029164.1 MerR family transcriptional regulator [Planctomycetota bacterium]MBT4559245.1 MerR family transcriptional regulator [Planctomycetota bacterium]MBT5101237.1 MerR family transcriptional regulator [Planctomycetota bacterium]MBT5119779.1 MerR family transcriptional regulator [Planctomycetota bacterium]
MGYLTYSLNELADLTGVEPRTIRAWIERGLIPGAQKRGRYAQYGRVHLTRVQFVQAVRRAAKVPLDQIRQMLISLPESNIVAIAEGREPVELVDPSTCSPELLSKFYSSKQAMLGLASLEPGQEPVAGIAFQEAPSENQLSNMQQSASWAGAGPLESTTATKGAEESAIERLTDILQMAVKGRKPQARAKAESWSSIPITPDVELRVRVGGMTEKELYQFEIIADYLRNLIMNPKEEDNNDY